MSDATGWGSLRRDRAEPAAIHIVFDGSPGHVGPRFIEVELDDGRSIRFGNWVQRPDGLWSLRFTKAETEAAFREMGL
jgi:hypothetical protein